MSGETGGTSDVASFLAFGVVAAAILFGRLLWRHPKVAAVLIVGAGAWYALRFPVLWAAVAVAAVLVAVWCVATRHQLKGARRRAKYRRSWADVCAAHRLSWAPHPKAAQNNRTQDSYWDLLIPSRRGSCPKLERIETGEWLDRLQVQILPGQTPDDWDREVEGIAHAFGARDGRVRADRPGKIKVELAYGDPLHTIVGALAITPRTDLGVIPVGLYEDGATWFVRVQGSHIFIAGDTGSGKSTVIGSAIRALCPAIQTGMVQVFACDPKGGQELTPYRPLLARFAWESFEDMASLLEQAVVAMQDRARRLAGVRRTHYVTPEEPLVVVLVDELATLTAYAPDRKIRERVTQALSLLLTQGRAVGYVVLAAVQDPRKEVVGMRNLFTTRIALRLNDATQVDMVLGDGARDMGAYCDRIPESLPGVGYVKVDGEREPRRVRAAYVTDDDIAAMCVEYGAESDRPPLRVVS